jgi:large subunit ribosomal protein L19
MDLIQRIVARRAKENNWTKKLESFSSGDTIKVHAKIKEGEKERVQIFKGVVIKIQGAGFNKTFTVRKISSGVGVERTFPFASPNIDKVEVVNRGKVRRSRLFFLRDLSGRSARLKSELVVNEGDAAVDAAEAVPLSAEAQAAETAAKATAKAAKAAKKEANAARAKTGKK